MVGLLIVQFHKVILLHTLNVILIKDSNKY